MKSLSYIIFILTFSITLGFGKNDQNDINIFSKITYQGGFLQSSKVAKINETTENVFYFNISDEKGGTSESLSSLFSSNNDSNHPERVFISSVIVLKCKNNYKAKLSYSVYKLVEVDSKHFFDLKHGIVEFEIKFNTKYQIPISELNEQKYEIYFQRKDDEVIKYSALSSEVLNNIENDLGERNYNIQMEYLQTNKEMTQIYKIDSFFPVFKSKNFYNTLTNHNHIFNKEIYFGELSFPFHIFDKREQAKIPNYERIKNNFNAKIKIFAVPILNENKNEFDIYITYSRFKGIYYCEWDTIKKRIKLNLGEKVKLELPASDWSMRAFNPLAKLNIDWYNAYQKHVKEYIIISLI